MSYPSLACDVDISLEAEHEAELWRLPACLEEWKCGRWAHAKPTQPWRAGVGGK